MVPPRVQAEAAAVLQAVKLGRQESLPNAGALEMAVLVRLKYHSSLHVLVQAVQAAVQVQLFT